MKELALHILDLVENSLCAHAHEVFITVCDDKRENVYSITIEDDGDGIAPERLATITDPYATSRTTRKIGMGLALAQQNAERCNGSLEIESVVGEGTTLHLWFEHNHWDRPPMGDISGTMAMLCSLNEEIHFVYRHITDQGSYCFDTNVIKAEMDGLSLNNIHAMRALRSLLQEQLEEIGYND